MKFISAFLKEITGCVDVLSSLVLPLWAHCG
jgi:hypothetical protein